MRMVSNEKAYQASEAQQRERVNARSYIHIATGQRRVLARIRIMDSTSPYFILSEVERRGQAKRLDHRGLDNRR